MSMLTPTQSNVLNYILHYRSEHGYSPTYGEIQKHFGWLSANASFDHVRALARHGYVKLGPRRMARAITPVENPPQKFPIVKDPGDTDWDQVCLDAERYRHIRDTQVAFERKDDFDSYIDSLRRNKHEAATVEPSESVICSTGLQSAVLGDDRLAGPVSFNQALREDQE